MNHAGHEIVKCSCGILIRQCRCFTAGKSERTIQNGCPTCQLYPQPTTAPTGPFFEYLSPAGQSVVEGLEAHEIVMAADQPQYNPLRCLVGRTEQSERLSRWTLTPAQRQAIADGADIFLELLTFHQPMNPIRIAVSHAPNPEYFQSVYRLEGKLSLSGPADPQVPEKDRPVG